MNITADLPVTPYLKEICEQTKNSPCHFLILTAETAAGKSTAVPPALLNAFPGKIVMLEPRRLAAVSIASRIAQTLGEPVGKTAGYRVHLDSKISRETRLEIITEAILTRQLQADPSLDGVSVVIIDEFHERSIHADLALAFLKEAMALRDNLYVIVMSATIETAFLSKYLGTPGSPAPVMHIPGRQFPVDIEYAGPISMSLAICRSLRASGTGPRSNTLLAFLPGISEIRRCQRELEECGLPDSTTEVLTLHSSVSFAEQQHVLEPAPEGITRIILSSAIAETSLTVPGVHLVIDSGLSRINRMNVSLGMEHLVTEAESQFSACQRSGRAGRLGPGKCIRLWNKNDVRPESTQPEILRADITSLVLECALWGADSPEKIDWLEPPSKAAWNEACTLLEQLGCLKQNRLTELGKACLSLGIHPRLACVALSGCAPLCAEFSSWSKSSPELKKRFISDLERRIGQLIPQPLIKPAASQSLALLNGFPDRIARLKDSCGFYQFPSGRVARLKAEDARRYAVCPEWIVAPEVDAGISEGTIYSHMALDASSAQEWLQNRLETKITAELKDNKILKNQITCLGKIIISSKKLQPTPEDYAPALCAQVQQKGLSSLPLGENSKSLMIREQFYAQQNGIESKADEESLCRNCTEWLTPFLAGKTKIDEETVYAALDWYLNGSTINRNVPSQIVLPNGKTRRLSYERQSSPDDRTKLVIRPVLEIIIQQIFGCLETPKVMGMPVLLKLLSPARRPLQITDNLESFWQTTWQEICKEMKGRYPKHNWDYRLTSAD